MRTNKINTVIIAFVLMMNGSFVVGQSDEIQPISKWFVKTNFKIPFSTSNYFFKSVGEGVVDLNGSLNYSFIKNVYAGIGYKYAYSKLNEQKLNSAPTDQFKGKIKQQGVYGELSYFFNVYENFSIEGNFQMGFESINTSSKFCVENGITHKKNGVFYSPNINFYLKSEEVFSFFLSLGYHFSTNGLEPNDMCVENFSGYKPADFTKKYQFFNVGFGIGISIVKPSKL